MRIKADYHTHTTFSHGKGSVLDNAIAAKNKGLEEIAITDHGFGHFSLGLKRKRLEEYKKDCDEAGKITGIKVLAGIEANIISLEGDLDLEPEDISQFEVIVCGFHKLAKAKRAVDFWGLLFTNYLELWTKKQIKKNTQAIIKAMDKYPIKILSHLGYGMKVDILEVAKAARDRGVLIELNQKHGLFTDEQILEMVAEKVKFVISSDAHRSENVGEANKILNLIIRLNIPKNLIVNLE